ncbi:hypothetical protein AX16_008764, partial [Volvariella volvacea WC 439]
MGSGINTSSPESMQRVANLFNDSDWRRPDSVVTMPSLMQASGIAAFNCEFGLPAAINFDGVSFVNRTRGNMPVFLQHTPSSLRTGSQYPASVLLNTKMQSLSGFNTNITVKQQGFTAHIVCQPRNTSLHRLTQASYTLPGNGAEMLDFVILHLNATCLDGSHQTDFAITRVYNRNGTDFADAVLIAFCFMNSNSPAHEVVLHGVGNPQFIGTMSCMVTPKVTTVQTNYASFMGFRLSSTAIVSMPVPLNEEDVEILD